MIPYKELEQKVIGLIPNGEILELKFNLFSYFAPEQYITQRLENILADPFHCIIYCYLYTFI